MNYGDEECLRPLSEGGEEYDLRFHRPRDKLSVEERKRIWKEMEELNELLRRPKVGEETT